MKIYDITQELFSSNVYPGDKIPSYKRISDMTEGAVCNITELEMNAHNGTHVDAPRHFVRDGKTIDQLDPEILIGRCTVKTFDHDLTSEDIAEIADIERILIRGKKCLTIDAAKALDGTKIRLIGVEPQSIAPIEAPMAVHVEVLSRGIIALEGLVLDEVPDGEYFLSALPLKLGGSDGSPTRAVLIDFDDKNS